MSQEEFNLCKNCSGLFHSPGGVENGICPNNLYDGETGPHVPKYPGLVFSHSLERGGYGGGVRGWSYCDKCKGIWYYGGDYDEPFPPHTAIFGGYCPDASDDDTQHNDNGWSAHYFLWTGGTCWQTCKHCMSLYNTSGDATNYCPSPDAEHSEHAPLVSLRGPFFLHNPC